MEYLTENIREKGKKRKENQPVVDGEADCRGGKWNRTVRTRGVAGGVKPLQDGIGCYATGHQSYLYTNSHVPLFFPPQVPHCCSLGPGGTAF